MSNPERINRYRDLTARGFGSHTTIWRKVRNGEFPAPFDILGRPGWPESIITQFLRSRDTQASGDRHDSGKARAAST